MTPVSVTLLRNNKNNNRKSNTTKKIVSSLLLLLASVVTGAHSFILFPSSGNKNNNNEQSNIFEVESSSPLTARKMTTSTTSNRNDVPQQQQEQGSHPFCDLPGDPSLILTTNIDLGSKKVEIMKGISKKIAEHTGKPEAYIAVCINDKADIVFGGTDEPAALGCLYSIGAIAAESNGQITSSVTDLLGDVDPARIYINFFDMPRANVGWSRRTFAG